MQPYLTALCNLLCHHSHVKRFSYNLNVVELFSAKSPTLAECKEQDLPLLNFFNLTYVCYTNPMKYLCSLYGFISIQCCAGDLCIPFRITMLSGLRCSEVVSLNLTAGCTRTCICKCCLFHPKGPYDNSWNM